MLYLHAIWTKDNCEEKVRIFTVEKEFIKAVRECCYSKGLAYSIEIYFLEANDKIEQGRCLGSRGLTPEQKQPISDEMFKKVRQFLTEHPEYIGI